MTTVLPLSVLKWQKITNTIDRTGPKITMHVSRLAKGYEKKLNSVTKIIFKKSQIQQSLLRTLNSVP